MNINRIIQALLIALLIIGLFAAMARNTYGFTFIGVACFGLAFLYLSQLSWKLIGDHFTIEKKDFLFFPELLLLALLLMLFGFRAFYIYLPGGAFIFIGVVCLLLIVYLTIGYGVFAETKKESLAMAWNMVSFFSSILLFLISMLTVAVAYWSQIFGAMAILVSIPFLYSVVRQVKYECQYKIISLFQFVADSKNKAGLIFIFFASSAIYTGLASSNIIPAIENASKPNTYIELINNAESGKEKPIDGQYQHEAYRQAMEKFLEHHKGK